MTVAHSVPWAPEARCYCAPRRLIFKLALGEDVARIPPRSLVMALGVEPAATTGHGAVDRVLRELGGNVALARLHDPASESDGFDMLEHAQGMSRTYVASFSDVHRLDNMVTSLRQLGVISHASLDYFVDANDALGALDTSAAMADTDWPWTCIGAAEASVLEQGDAAITTAVLDTGAATRHVELFGRLSSGFDAVNFSSADLATGLSLMGDFGVRDIDPDESDNPHGTACLAIIGGRGQGMPRGLSAQTTLMPVRVLASAQSPGPAGNSRVMGLGALSDIDYAFKHCVDLGAKVLNCSFGTAETALLPGDPKPHADTTAYALARGTIVVAASGNTGKSERFYPAATDGVIAVGSFGPDDRPSEFSTRGDHVAISAPGERILTPGITGYQRSTGTSFAAPFVAGTAALLVARARRSAHALTSAQTRDLLIRSARSWPGDAPDGGGAGLLDIPAALSVLDADINSYPPEQERDARW